MIKGLTIRQRTTIYTMLVSIFPNILIMLLGAFKTSAIINVLGSEVNGVYQVMLQLSSFVTFANLGLESSFRLAYYKYLNEEKNDEVTAIYNYSIRFFKKMSIVMLVISVIISIISIFFIGDALDFMQVISLQFLLCMPSVTSFYIGKDISLADARQKGYTYLLLYNVTYIIRMIISLVIIYVLKNMFIFLAVDALIYSISNLVIGRYLKKDNEIVISKCIKRENKDPIKTNKYILTFKLSKQVFFNTDGLIMSTNYSKTSISIYSTYMYIANCLIVMTSYITNAFQNSLGNLFHSDDNYKEDIVKKLCVSTIFMSLVLVVPLTIGMESFISKIWIADNSYLLSKDFYFFVCVYFSLSSFKYYVDLIEDTANLYKVTYKINLLEAFLNIVLSFLLMFMFGMVGIILATIITMLICMLIKQIILFNNLKMNTSHQIANYFKYIIILIVEIVLSMMILNCINLETIISWIIIMIIVTLLSVVIVGFVVFAFFKEFKEIIKEILLLVRKVR